MRRAAGGCDRRWTGTTHRLPWIEANLIPGYRAEPGIRLIARAMDLGGGAHGDIRPHPPHAERRHPGAATGTVARLTNAP